jgi:hypothetical protein
MLTALTRRQSDIEGRYLPMTTIPLQAVRRAP